jgi:hypothetical protein
MKQIVKNIAAGCILVFSGCSLNTEPEDFISPAYFYNTVAECDQALTAVYDKMNYSFANLISAPIDAADEMWAAGSTTGTWLYYFYSNDGNIAALWSLLYDGIERANMLLANIDRAEIDETQKNRIKGEAKFLRAYYYFLLVQNWGDIPLKTEPTKSAADVYYARTSQTEVYDFIYKEMVEAEALVRPISEYTYSERVTQSAVQGFLARVSLFMAGFPINKPEKYKDALAWSEKAIQSGQHSLNPDYSQVFINMIQDKYDIKESIWEIGFRWVGNTDTYAEFGEIGNANGINQNILGYGMSTGQYLVYQSLWNKYESTDTRRDWAIAPFSYKYNSKPPEKVFYDNTKILDRHIGKFRREYELTPFESQQKRATPTNWPLLRYSDILLMAAEAENEVNGPTAKALQYLNEVRARANASLITSVAGKEGFRHILQEERSMELCFEGLRKMDLRRWGILVPRMKEVVAYVQSTYTNATSKTRASVPGTNISEQHLYFPIPLREMNLNNLLTQNPGW